MGHCDTAPIAEVGHHYVDHATPERVAEALRRAHTHADVPDYSEFERYVEGGGYRALEACRAGEHTFELLVATLGEAGLRGLGGAGFPTGRKWEFVRKEPKPRYLAVNADEGEPGTFKDRHYLERDPHRFLEGALIAAWSIEAEAAYIYLRDEYPGVRDVLLKEIPKVEAAGLAKAGYLRLRRGAGAYICGEESAMLESIEGKRGYPAPQAALCRPGRPVRPPDADQQRRDPVLDPRHRREGSRMVRRAKAATARRACAATPCRGGSRNPGSSWRPRGSRHAS